MALPSLARMMTEGTVVSAWSGLGDAAVHEILVRSPVDAITFDVQHGHHDVASVREGIGRAALMAKPALVRGAIEDRANAARFLDFGASAVIMPMIEGAADTRAFVDAVKYPPVGQRSYGPTLAAQLHCGGDSSAYTAVANRETLAFAMIETRAALDALGAILGVEGLDGVFVGPSDLSIALAGDVAKRDPGSAEAVAAISHILATVRSAGKFAGIYAGTLEEAAGYKALGYDLVCVSSDGAILQAGITQIARTLKS